MIDLSPYSHLWIVFALLSAFFHASRLTLTKWLSITFSVEVLSLYVNLASLLVTLPLVVWHHDFPLTNPKYVAAVLCGGIFSGLGGWAVNYALHRSDVSLVGPMMTLTPGFVILIEWLIIGSLPNALGFVGIGLLVGGSYMLSLSGRDRAWLHPLQALITDPGSRYTLVAAACFAAATTFGRIGIHLSDPLSFAVIVAVINPLVLFLVFSLKDRHFYRELIIADVRRCRGALVALGLLFALMRLADQIALSLTLASYAMAVKRTAGLFTVVMGWRFFREGDIKRKLAASTVMLLGLLVLTLN